MANNWKIKSQIEEIRLELNSVINDSSINDSNYYVF